MAQSFAHKFGQIVGGVLERAIYPGLKSLAVKYKLYLDIKGKRAARGKRTKVSWLDLHNNNHDLDFVLERHGTDEKNGSPVAFIEAAWRRYTKHSRNKSQEIQGAITPLADNFQCHAPFIGVVLAGEYSQDSLVQLERHGFHVVHISYESVIKAFSKVDIDARSDEDTLEKEFERKVRKWETMTPDRHKTVETCLAQDNRKRLSGLYKAIEKTINRTIERVVVLPLHGMSQDFSTVEQAIRFIDKYDERMTVTGLDRYEIQIRYTNGDSINGSFGEKRVAIDFLEHYLPSSELIGRLPVKPMVKIIGGSILKEEVPKESEKRRPKRKNH